MKKLLLVFMITACILGLTACGSVMYDSEMAPAMSPGSAMPVGGGMSDMMYELSETGNQSSVHTELPSEQTRKIIRDGNMTVEAENAVELYSSLAAFNRSLGGYEFSASTHHHDLFTSVEAVLKVPPEKLDELMAFAGENGKIIRSATASDDVTDRYFDMKTRVETKRRSLESYYNLLERADTASEIITIQRTIDGIIEEIEAFEGRLRVLDSLVEMATLRLYISQKNDPVLERRDIDWNALDFSDMGYFIRNGFIAVVNFIATIIKWVIIAVIVTSPLWILPAIAIVIFILVRRHNKKKKAKEKLPPSP
jgi:hypothetical protein